MNRRFRFSTIRTQLTVKTIGMVCLAFVVCYAAAYSFFSSTLMRRTLQDNVNTIAQHTLQMSYINRDVTGLAEIVASNQSIQRLLDNHNQASVGKKVDTYDQYSTIQNTIEEVKRISYTRPYFRSAALIPLDHQAYHWGTLANYNQLVEEEYYYSFLDSGESSVYYGPNRQYFMQGYQEMFTYLLRVRNISQSYQMAGTLILNFDLSYFTEPMEAAAASFDGYLFMNSETIMYSDGLKPEDVAELEELTPDWQGDVEIYETDMGYYLAGSIESSEWRVITFTERNRLLKSSRALLPFLLVTLAAAIILCLLLIRPTIHNITRPLEQLAATMESVSAGNLSADIDIDSQNEVGLLASTFSRMLTDLNLHINEALASEKARQSLKLELLLAQMNPHFIYNTLNSIVYLARKEKNKDIVSLTTSFIKMLQDILPRDDMGPYTTIGRDMDVLQAYFVIQRYRYADLFEEELDLDPAVSDWIIPKSILQPIAENAIFHGIYPSGRKGKITIRAYPDGDAAVVEISDNGIGIDSQRILELMENHSPSVYRDSVRSIGIANINSRLAGIYGEQTVMSIHSLPGEGAVFRFRFPEIR